MDLFSTFDPRTANKDEIEAMVRPLVRKRLSEVIACGAVREVTLGNKGQVGQLVERFFGIKPNSESEPDFVRARIELKVVPILRRGELARAKERTSVTMIDYMDLERESWSTASVRQKLDHILFVFYEHVPPNQAFEAEVLAYSFWNPSQELLPQICRDWTVVRDKVRLGRAHEISERDGRILGAATKGAGHGRTVQQPRSSQRARPRAWALKPCLTSWIYDTTRQKPQVSILEALQMPLGGDPELGVLERLERYIGRQLGDVADSLGVELGNAKNWAASVVRRAIGVTNDRALLTEFEQRGITIKVVPISPRGKVWEAMSFPRFIHEELALERWETCEFRTYIERILIVPLIRSTKRERKENQVWGRAFFWSPSDCDLQEMRHDWLRIVRLVRQGRSASLPSYGETLAIHVRPKARNSSDREIAPRGISVVKRCFWLNPSFVERIVTENHGLAVPGASDS